MSKDEKTSNRVQQGKNRQNHMFTRLPSSPARHGELTKAKIGREACLLAPARHQLAMASYQKEKIGRSMVVLAMASEITCEASKVSQTPQDDVAETQWGRKLCSPWRATELARRVDADGKSL